MSSFFWSEPIHFPSKMVPCRFSLDLPLFGLRPSSRGHGSNLWLSTNRIGLFNWTLDLALSSKVACTYCLLPFMRSFRPHLQSLYKEGTNTNSSRVYRPHHCRKSTCLLCKIHMPHCPNHENHYVMESAGYKTFFANFGAHLKILVSQNSSSDHQHYIPFHHIILQQYLYHSHFSIILMNFYLFF